MNIKTTKQETKATVYISGSIDIPGSENMKKVFHQLLEENFKEITINFEEVTFIGSSGIGKLLLFYKNMMAKGGKVNIINMNDEIIALFKSIKLDKLFNI